MDNIIIICHFFPLKRKEMHLEIKFLKYIFDNYLSLMSTASIRESLSIITKNILENNLRGFYSEVNFFFL